jgi:hypothetical protein
MKGKIILLLVAALLISGCTPARIPTRADVVEIKYIHPAPPAPLALRDIQWRVLNAEELEKYLEANREGELALFALETRGYESLALNMQEIIRYIREQQAIINYYRRILPDAEEVTSER